MHIIESVNLIESYLDLKRKPVGVKLLFSEKEFDEFPLFQRDSKITYCNAVQMASKGNSMKITKENHACPNGATALKMKEVSEVISSGEGRYHKNIYHDLETSKGVSDEMMFLEKEPFGIALRPLNEYFDHPDVVIIVGSSYNIMRLIQGYAYFNGYTSNLKTVGLQAVCHDLTTYPYNTKDINISLLCPGTRLVANWQADEIGIGIPFEKWFQVVEGVVATSNPFERNKNKENIEARLKERNLNTSEIRYNENYDDGQYTGGKLNSKK